ncbi:uncharacterized protein CANTADRAFT_24568 [Suhomyces tanzawaensis NRRL Y-17324]|uniref:Zf-CHY-domain-containing protein n=1 Tax=Suhomyces tanzawaensis NRRL Y-17324 TaxID=984487 RepID=A0A1E4SQE9_9ASCO|nr:uncharacterized protein CANTADRAFT_24568 [Suhomyces tanzawaensis NRRL Y-17324]ODV81740.1 hypothetical protein CANTADRAFT_24568 [Suhomyces tanzawaensis NRRL Y-17324]
MATSAVDSQSPSQQPSWSGSKKHGRKRKHRNHTNAGALDSDGSDNSLTEDLDQIGKLNLNYFNLNLASYLNKGAALPTTSNMLHHPHKDARDLDSDASENSLTEDLDKIGRLNLNYLNLNLGSYLNREAFLTTIPDMPNLPNLPTFELGRIQEFSKEFSTYVTSYIRAAKPKEDNENPEGDYQRLISSIKTSISTRIQMNNFLNDLDLGLSITAAVERLQPLTDIINETISLPVEDTSDYDDDYDQTENNSSEEQTEPGVVRKIVNSEQPLINEIVKPEAKSVGKYKRRKGRIQEIYLNSNNDESGTATSDLDNVDGLTPEEVKALTDLNSLDDFIKEDLLRQKIQKIQGLTNLQQLSKNKLVTRLMMGNYYRYVNEKLLQNNNGELPLPSTLKHQKLVLKSDPREERGEEIEREEEIEFEPLVASENESDEDEVMLTEQDTVPSYHDLEQTILGCQHYQRNCKLECPTCLKWYPCRFCHDAVESHKLVRSDVKHILCMKCNTPQVPDSPYCINCEQELANYFCSKCVLYDNDTTKDIYHCDKCGICRLGLGLDKDYFHCDECNNCLSIDLRENHKCLTNTTHCDCPICNEYLFTSVHKVVFMKCGHSIHQHCYDELIKHSYKCPLCKKTVVNAETQFRILDQEILQSPLPAPYSNWRCIVGCNDCKGKSNVGYHVLGLKCKYCKSYNTNQLRLIKPEEEDDENTPAAPEIEQAGFDMHLMRLAQTNLLNNFHIDDQHDEDEENYGDVERDDDDDDDDEGNDDDIIDLRKLTQSDQSNLSYIRLVFQNFINNTVS